MLNNNFQRRAERPKFCVSPLKYGEQWPADGRLAQKSSDTRVLGDLPTSRFISANQVTTLLSKAIITNQSIDYSPTGVKTYTKLSVFTPGRKTIHYWKPRIRSRSSIWPLLARSTRTLHSMFSTWRHPLPSRIIPISAQNSPYCKFGSLISCCLKHHQILTNNTNSFREINQIFPRLLHAL